MTKHNNNTLAKKKKEKKKAIGTNVKLPEKETRKQEKRVAIITNYYSKLSEESMTRKEQISLIFVG